MINETSFTNRTHKWNGSVLRKLTFLEPDKSYLTLKINLFIGNKCLEVIFP